ncbi:hypothetical protein [Pseudofrankia saprophytica]|uniref:hypothetical protein n=1 Tax=Pseudofrankia saprophytica TaxID=298655 RepID=UPI0018E2E2F6|nr:hypothetical protein [Pseudofrankia saprophytica]
MVMESDLSQDPGTPDQASVRARRLVPGHDPTPTTKLPPFRKAGKTAPHAAGHTADLSPSTSSRCAIE